ncbi:tRNA pseudouridine synthase C [Diplonema papillatum]|nr:tRNA pseudouridine synthase C [Diplonema papillatum]
MATQTSPPANEPPRGSTATLADGAESVLREQTRDANRTPWVSVEAVFVLVARAHHRLDELSRTLAAALWGGGPAAGVAEVWLVMLSADDKEKSYAKLDSKFVASLGGPTATPSEDGILQAVASRQKEAPRFPTIEACLNHAVTHGCFTPRPTDVLVVLHEDAPFLVPPKTTMAGFAPADAVSERDPPGNGLTPADAVCKRDPPGDGECRRAARGWGRSLWLLGVHEDFLKPVAAIRGHLAPLVAAAKYVSLGPVPLHTSACVHSVLGSLALPEPCRPPAAYQSLAKPPVRNPEWLFKPTHDPRSGMRCVPNRGPVTYWVFVPTGGPAAMGPAQRKGLQLAFVAGIWASKSAYRECDTQVVVVFRPGGGEAAGDAAAVVVDRRLLGEMPREELAGKAPNEANVLAAWDAFSAKHAETYASVLRRVFSSETEVLVLEARDSEQLYFPDAPEVPCRLPHPRDAPLHVFFDAEFPANQLAALLEAGAALRAHRLACALRGTSASTQLPRALVLLQGSHSIGRLKPTVREHGTPETVRSADPRRSRPAAPVSDRDILWGVDTGPAEAWGEGGRAALSVEECLEKWRAGGLRDAGTPLGRDTVCPGAEVVALAGAVTAVRYQGKVQFLGVSDARTGARIQAVLPLKFWPERAAAAAKRLSAGDQATLVGVPGHTGQGRLSLFAKLLVAVGAAPPARAAVAFVGGGAEFAGFSKPCGMQTHLTATTRAAERPTACCCAAALLGVRKLYPVHTIEKDASGVVVFSKTAKAADDVAKLVKPAVRTYLVLAVGVEDGPLPSAGDAWTADTPLKEVLRDGSKTRRQAKRELQPAVTRFEALLTIPAARCVVLEAVPVTAGTRQIRRHLAERSLSIVGDHEVGNPNANRTFAQTYAFAATALHLRSLALADGTTLTAPLPPPMVALLKALPCDSKDILAKYAGEPAC